MPTPEIPIPIIPLHQTPILYPSLPIRYPPLPHPHKYNPNLLPLNKTIRAPIPPIRLRRLPPKTPLLPRLISKSVILQMPLLTPPLLLTALLHHHRLAIDSRTNTRQRTRVYIQ